MDTAYLLTDCFSLGLCRFEKPQAVTSAMSAIESGDLLVNGKKPSASLLAQPLLRERPVGLPKRAVSLPSPALAKPTLGRRRSHQRNTVTMDTVLDQTPLMELVTDAPIVSPEQLRSTLRPNVFTNIPARGIFDTNMVSPEPSPVSMVVKE